MYLKIAAIRILIIIFLLPVIHVANAQKEIEYGASRQTGTLERVGRGDDRYFKLTDSVWYYIKDKDINILGDSSLYYDRLGRLEVFGDVRVNAQDSTDITSKKLVYLMDQKIAQFREDVFYRDPDVKLYTDSLDYNLNSGNSSYFGGGKVLDDSITLTSKRGLYNSTLKLSIFERDVVLKSTEYTLYSENLNYDIRSKVARTTTPTDVVASDGRKAFAQKGLVYNASSEKTTLQRGSISTPDYMITGNQLFQDKKTEIYKARGDVVMTSISDQLVITGQKSDYYKNQGLTVITGLPVLKKEIEQGDTLYLRADTLISLEIDSLDQKWLFAYKNVRVFREGLQGIADSAVYNVTDSMFTFFQDPVLWNEDTQMTGDSVQVVLKGNTLEKLTTFGKSFIISSDSLSNHNQVRGREIISYFTGQMISHVEVLGNAESLYYVMEKDSVFMGVNKSTSSTMLINMKNNQVQNIMLYKNPEAKIIPPHEMKDEDKRLDGYQWRIDERPTQAMVLYYAQPKRVDTPKKGDNKPAMKGILFNE